MSLSSNDSIAIPLNYNETISECELVVKKKFSSSAIATTKINLAGLKTEQKVELDSLNIFQFSIDPIYQSKDYNSDQDKIKDGMTTHPRHKKPVFTILFPDRILFFIDNKVNFFFFLIFFLIYFNFYFKSIQLVH